MATKQLKAIQEIGKHGVGNLNVAHVDTLNGGAVITGSDVDNFTIVELAGFNIDGEQQCKQLLDKTHYGYLIANPEQRFMGEDIVDYYNAIGEKCRLVVLKPHYTRFETSKFSLNDGVKSLKKGLVAHFDVAKKEYILSDASAPHADYIDSALQFEVVGDVDDTAGHFDVDVIRLLSTKA